MIRMIPVTLALFVFLSPICRGQEPSQDREQVFAPFVSRLKASVKDSSIVLTWRNVRDISGTSLVYRHTEEITERNHEQAVLIAKVEPKTESYTDFPSDTNPYYYAVIVESEDGKRYDLFIPFRNKTIIGARVEYVGAPELRASRIKNIRAEVSKDTIIVSFVNDRPNRDMLIYRSDAPLQQLGDLVNAVSWVVVAGTDRYEDRPPAGIDFYYAVLAVELVQLGKVDLVPGENSTQFPIRIPLEAGSIQPSLVPTQRNLPLPYLVITREIFSGQKLRGTASLPQKVDLNPATIKAVARILTRSPAETRTPGEARAPAGGKASLGDVSEIKAKILDIDRNTDSGREDYILKSIVEKYLLSAQYGKTEIEILNFLSIRRGEDLETRAHFYLGQVYYFQKQYRKALLEFLLARNSYYGEVRHWLDACFDKMTLSK
ncbi:MAG TPA: hypothetical protein VMX75_14920 [Spirochaetia bacterium]|nr:hypothetical protein [Spirochaetia bacterium]